MTAQERPAADDAAAREDDAAAQLKREWRLHWGALLRTARQVAGLTLSELAAMTGLSKGYLSKLESGYEAAANPSRTTLAKLAQALPSFGPLAHMLTPHPMGALLSGTEAAHTLPMARPTGQQGATVEAAQEPIMLGWRELELLVALLALERSAVAQPLTALTLARAIGRTRESVEEALEALTTLGALLRRPPARFGGAPTYQRAPNFEARVGLSRVGDALVLAAALLSQKTEPRSAAARRGERGEVSEARGAGEAGA